MEKRLRPNPRGIVKYFILLAVTLYVWNFFRSYFLFLALVVVVCSPAVSLLLLLAGRDQLLVQAVLPANRVGKGTAFPFDIRVNNSSRFAVFTADVTYSWKNLFTGYSEQQTRRLWIAPRYGAEIRQLLSSQYAGRVEVGIEHFEIFDLCHMFRLQSVDRAEANVTVWPAFTEESEEEIHSYVEGFPKENETKKRGTDYNPDYEIREYIPGDELKSIHWKLSAKQDQLMVRERLASGREKINVLLPLGDDRQENDGLMEAVYAVCRLLLQKEYPIQLYWPGRGEELQGRFLAEQGELEHVLEEILSDSGFRQPGDAQGQMSVKCSGESYILIRTGAYKGVYIR